MKPTITTLQQSYFKERGKITFENFPLDTNAFKEAIDTTLLKRSKVEENEFIRGRDLWRDSPFLSKLLTRKIAPLLMDLLDKKKLRLLADQYFPPSIVSKAPIETFFGFQPLLAAVSIGETVTFYHPSMPLSPEEGYFAIFSLQNTSYIKKESDPANHLIKKMGYSFNDQLTNEFHPLLFSV